MKLLNKLICRHEWSTIKKEIIKSPFERTKDDLKTVKASESFYLETHITILTCKLCGKVYESIVKGVGNVPTEV